MPMKEYEIAGMPVTITDGKLRLTDKQAGRRSHLLVEAKGKNMYEVIRPVQFKIGERFEWDGEVQKSMADYIVDANALDKEREKVQKAADDEAAKKAAEEEATKKAGGGPTGDMLGGDDGEDETHS